jgi:hypothetical protein
MTIVIAIGASLALLIGGLALFTALNARQAESLVPPLGRFVEVDGARLHIWIEAAARSSSCCMD